MHNHFRLNKLKTIVLARSDLFPAFARLLEQETVSLILITLCKSRSVVIVKVCKT